MLLEPLEILLKASGVAVVALKYVRVASKKTVALL